MWIVQFAQNRTRPRFYGCLIACKSDEDSIESEIAIARITFSKLYGALKCVCEGV